MSTFTSVLFDLDRRKAESVMKLAGTVKEDGEGREEVPIDKRIVAFSYLANFLGTFAVSMSDTRGMGELQRLHDIKFRLGGVVN